MKKVITDRRAAMGITQRELAQMLGISQSTVAMWETGERSPKIHMIPKLAQVLGCTIDELFGR